MKLRYHPYWQEMIEWGEVGILSSIQDYDPSYGTTFLTFATYKIETELRNFLHSIRMAYTENYYPDDEDEEGDWAGEELCFLACQELRPLEKMFLSERRYSFRTTTAICNRAATGFSVLPGTIHVRTGLGAGASTSTKNHPLSGMGNRWFCQSGYQVALLAKMIIYQLCTLEESLAFWRNSSVLRRIVVGDGWSVFLLSA